MEFNLQVVSVFSKYCCLSAKLCDFILPLEEQASFNGPTLAFDTWHSLQALLCLPFLAHEIFSHCSHWNTWSASLLCLVLLFCPDKWDLKTVCKANLGCSEANGQIPTVLKKWDYA